MPIWIHGILSAAPKQSLTKSVLVEAGIATQYDRYLMNSIEIVTPPTTNQKFLSWLHQLLVKEVGWQQMESQYIARLESNFSPKELQELESLVKHPLLQKLLQVDAKIYAELSSKRRQTLSKVWDNYNQGKYEIPVDVK
jgi:disulfide oxidoreductase YuzD